MIFVNESIILIMIQFVKIKILRKLNVKTDFFHLRSISNSF